MNQGIKSISQVPVVAVAGIGLLIVAALAYSAGGAKLGAAALIGGLAGLTLYHAAFGFTAAWRRMVTERRGAGLRAQMLLIGLTAALSFPLIGWGADFDMRTGGFVFPFGIAAAIGAFMFGVGMQLGGGCGSGTLFTAGGGSTRMMLTLAAFIAGSVIATAHLHHWNTLPRFGGTSVIREFGVVPALVLTVAVLGAIALGSIYVERRHHGSLAAPRKTGSVLHGPWSLILGAVGLTVVGVLTFLVLSRPWGITSAFALWGAKIGSTVGVPVETWPYWERQTAALDRTVFADATSVMNFGIMLGAMGAAALAGKYAPKLKLTPRDMITAVIGGLMMGYGARLAYGCNIGGYLGGVVSGSLHGWWWLVFGFAGSFLGTRLRFLFGMDQRPPSAPSPQPAS